MDRNPVTKEGIRQYSKDFNGGIKRPSVTTGPIDESNTRIARRALTSNGKMFGRNAGMLVDTTQNSVPYTSGYKLDAYRTSYANGLGGVSGTYDIPTYFQQMNEQNGGILYWPATLQEKYSWYRYWARSDAYIGRSLELLTDLPMSKLSLTIPNYVPKKNKQEIQDFFEAQLEEIDAFQLLMSILWEQNMIGQCSIFHEWDDERKMWSKAVILPPEEVYIFNYPFSEHARVEYKPERIISLIETHIADGQSSAGDISSAIDGKCSRGSIDAEIVKNIPQDLIDMVKEEGCIVMDTDPSTGSFVHSMARRKSQYEDIGASPLERVLVPMLQKEHYRYTQLSLSSRNMTPKNLITAVNLMPEELDDLRTQVDFSYMDPDYSIITNYEVGWEQIGAQDRLLDLSREYETIENQIFAALGTTRELLTGEGAFSGNKITVEILNTMFLNTRQNLVDYIEKKLFKPIAEAHDWYTEDKNGIKKYWYPKVSFNRLTIRDNAEVFDSLFNLYQKGSLPIQVIYELFNLDADKMAEVLKEDLFKVNDATFNRMVEEVNSEVGRAIVEKTNIVEKQADYLGLDFKEPEGGEEGGFGDGDFDGGGFGGDFGEESEEQPEDSVEKEESEELVKEEHPLVSEIVDELPHDATEEEVRSLIEDKEGNE